MAAWIWFGLFGVLTNLAAIAFLWAALRTSLIALLAPLQQRALVNAVLAVLGGGLGVAFGAIKAFGAIGGESVDPSQRAQILAEGISEAMNCAASGLVTGPLPIAALIAIAMRTKRARQAESQDDWAAAVQTKITMPSSLRRRAGIGR